MLSLDALTCFRPTQYVHKVEKVWGHLSKIVDYRLVGGEGGIRFWVKLHLLHFRGDTRKSLIDKELSEQLFWLDFLQSPLFVQIPLKKVSMVSPLPRSHMIREGG